MDVLLLDLNDRILYNMLSRQMGFRISTYTRLSNQFNPHVVERDIP